MPPPVTSGATRTGHPLAGYAVPPGPRHRLGAMFDVAGLRVMRAVAEHGSFTAAAQALGYTQPAISQMVRRLERRTGTVLVERHGRRVRLTEAGQALARHAGIVMDALD